MCLEVTCFCPQCQISSDYSLQKKTSGISTSFASLDTLSNDAMGPLLSDHQMEFILAFVGCFSRYTIHPHQGSQGPRCLQRLAEEGHSLFWSFLAPAL